MEKLKTNVIDEISLIIGIAEPQLRFLLTILSTYLIAFTYRALLYKKITRYIRILYNLFFSLALIIFFTRGNRMELVILIQPIFFTWLAIKIGGDILNFRKSISSIAAICTFFYLLYCYKKHSTNSYDLNFLTPLSVLSLRLMGLALDYGDFNELIGNEKKPESRINDWQPLLPEKDRGLQEFPSLIETLSFCLYYGTFFVGPQFPYKLYEKFISLELFYLERKKGDKIKGVVLSGSISSAIRQFFIGAFYLAMNEVGNNFMPMTYFESKQFLASSFFFKLGFIVLLGKYFGIWKLSEVALIVSGVSYNGYSSVNDKYSWNSLENFRPNIYEKLTNLGDVIVSFNVNTNIWSKIYIFKRLRFLNNKNLSAIATLFFLAIWHGWHIGYLLAFSLEFVDMEAERRWKLIMQKNVDDFIFKEKNNKDIPKKLIKAMYFGFSHVYCTFCLGYALIPFNLLHWEPTKVVWSSVYYIGHLIPLSIFIFSLIVPMSKKHGFEQVQVQHTLIEKKTLKLTRKKNWKIE
ncbi:Lysophosphatidylcholine acyltransferase 3 [Lobulomyces angularis]|nr:Lysophosphatidylcholine acyltransferase 3 [Lobulomyces angularis]